MIAISFLLKATLLLASTAVIHSIFGRHMSAGARHLLWTLLVIALLLLPVLSFVLPSWTVVVRPTRSTVSPTSEVHRLAADEFKDIGAIKAASTPSITQSRIS